MPATATLEELEKVQNELEALKMKNPEIYEDFVKLFKRNRSGLGSDQGNCLK